MLFHMNLKKSLIKILATFMIVLTIFIAPFTQIAQAAPLYGWGSNAGTPSAANALSAYILGNGVAGRSSGTFISLDLLEKLNNKANGGNTGDYAYGVNNNIDTRGKAADAHAIEAVNNLKMLYDNGYIQAFENGDDVGAKQGTLALAPAALGASVFSMAFGLVQSIQQSIVNINPVNVFGLTDDSTNGVTGGMTPHYAAEDGILGGKIKELFANAGVDASLIRAFAGLALTIMIALFVLALVHGLRNISEGKNAFSKAGQFGLRVLTILFATPFAIVLISGLSTLSGNTFQAAYQSLGTVNDDLIVDSLQYAGLTNYDTSLLPDGGKAETEGVKKLNEEIEKVRLEIEAAQRKNDYNKLAELQYGVLPQLEKDRTELQEKAKEHDNNKLLKQEIDSEEIAEIVGKWTGIPVSKLMQGEKEKILNLAKYMKERVIGQDDAIETISDTIIRSRAGLKDPNRPIGSFIFLGPTGVGKTYLTKTLSLNLFDDENNIVRIDMSEYMDKFSVTRLIGAPPGYVGYEEGGQLTEAVRRKPYSVILFDEIEKAHPDVFNVLLQLLDDGRLTDGKGKVVDFKNTIVIMTSNIGSEIILEDPQLSDTTKEAVLDEMKHRFKPEFLNRIDDIIIFKSLGKDSVKNIIKLILEDINHKLKEQFIKVEFTDNALDFIVNEAYDPAYGARPLKRFVQKDIETNLSKMILSNEIPENSTILIDSDGEKLTYTVKK